MSLRKFWIKSVRHLIAKFQISLRPYQRAVAMLIAEKYNLPFEEARKKFVSSETYAMLADSELAMGTFSARALLDMWEVEQKTGNPRNSAYIAIDDYEQ